MSNKRLTSTELTYIEQLMNKIMESLKQVNLELSKDNYIYSSKARARFNKLRVELNTELLQVKKRLYNGK